MCRRSRAGVEKQWDHNRNRTNADIGSRDGVYQGTGVAGASGSTFPSTFTLPRSQQSPMEKEGVHLPLLPSSKLSPAHPRDAERGLHGVPLTPSPPACPFLTSPLASAPLSPPFPRSPLTTSPPRTSSPLNPPFPTSPLTSSPPKSSALPLPLSPAKAQPDDAPDSEPTSARGETETKSDADTSPAPDIPTSPTSGTVAGPLLEAQGLTASSKLFQGFVQVFLNPNRATLRARSGHTGKQCIPPPKHKARKWCPPLLVPPTAPSESLQKIPG